MADPVPEYLSCFKRKETAQDSYLNTYNMEEKIIN